MSEQYPSYNAPKSSVTISPVSISFVLATPWGIAERCPEAIIRSKLEEVAPASRIYISILLLISISVTPGRRSFNMFEKALSAMFRSEEHTSELQSRGHLVCRLLLEKKK